jgi:hypothetical protein
MNKPTLPFTLTLLLATLVMPLTSLAAGYHYAIHDDGFWIHNGTAYFNRPLFGTHEPSMLLSGDRPAFAYFAPGDVGKIGTLYIGLVTARGGKWLDHFSEIDSVYQPGLTRHIVKDPDLTTGVLEVTAVPLSSVEGFTIRLRWIDPPAERVRLVWAFGGASGYNVNYEALIEKLQLSESDTAQDVSHVWGSRFSLTSPTMKGKELWGTCDMPGSLTFGEPREVIAGPMEAESAGSGRQPVVVFGGDWSPAQTSVHLIFTMAGVVTLEELAARPAQTFEQSVQFYRALAKRVQVRTPDPYFDLAVEAMVIANDGLWIPPSFVHGALSWMEHYVGWRTCYGSEALGWHDRARSHILASAARQVQSGDNRGGIPHMLEGTGLYYNMNEVYLDDIYYHYLWTGDRGLLASLFPVIQGILSWEKRRLDPDDNALYENCLNTWISDSHWYSGGDCTQASAYMFRGHQLAAEAAEAAGVDPRPFRQEAERIRAAMNDKLWLASAGHYAEFIDHLGLKRIHPEPELPTIYHPIDFGVTDQFQAYQMLRFTETNLRNETAIPNGGRLVWSSNWAPNYDKHYTHSTYDLVFAESLNLAIAYYRAGQFDKAYELVKGVYASMYQGGIPGGLSCHAYSNGQQRANEEFGDAISMFARTAVEGVFGILPEMQRGIIHISPGFPKDWKDASISTPDLSYRFHKTDSEITIQVDTPQPLRIHYRVPLLELSAAEVSVNGSQAEARIEPGVGGAFVDVTGPSTTRSSLNVKVRPRTRALRFQPVVAAGTRFMIETDGAPLQELRDPQAFLEQAKLTARSLAGTITNKLGPHTLFVLVGDRNESAWEPVDMEVRPPAEILNPQLDLSSGACAFVLRNNTAAAMKAKGTVLWAGKTTPLGVELPPHVEQNFKAEGDMAALLLGKNLLKIAGLPIANTLTAEVLYWPEASPSTAAEMKWKLLRLDQFYNGSLSTVLSHPFWTSDTDYPYAVCLDYMLEHLVGDRSGRPNDNLLRSRVNDAGVFLTHVGIPFSERAKGDNIVGLSRWKEFPDHISVPVQDVARKIYLLISGVTFPMQSQIANLRVVVNYADGGKSNLDLVNPDNFDSGWRGFYGGNYHYAANGMEVIGTGPPEEKDVEAKDMPIARPRTILAEQGVPERLDYSKWATATHADIVDVDCDPARKIQNVTITVLSNEIIVAVHGITLLK